VTQTSATVEELAQTSSQIAENSGAVVRIAERTLASAEEGMQTVADTAEGIEEIRATTQQSSDRILALDLSGTLLDHLAGTDEDLLDNGARLLDLLQFEGTLSEPQFTDKGR